VDLWAGLPAQVLMRRPDVRQAEASLAAAQANVESARAALFPKIVLTGSGGTASSELTQLFKAGTWGWSVAPQVLQTLFDAGRNQANLSAAQMGRDVAWLQYDKAIQSAFREASDAIASHATWQQQLRSVQQQERAEQDRARLIRLRVDQGAASELEGLDAQRAAWSAQMQLIQAQAQFAQVRISLYKALGGGWAVQRP
jgi:multidrug efflux system outer membrane protein